MCLCTRHLSKLIYHLILRGQLILILALSLLLVYNSLQGALQMKDAELLERVRVTRAVPARSALPRKYKLKKEKQREEIRNEEKWSNSGKGSLQMMLLHENPRFMEDGMRCKVEYLGCVETPKTKAGSAKSMFDKSTLMVRPEMTLNKCFENCSSQGYELAAIQMTHCICIGTFAKGEQLNVLEDGCQHRCPGNPEQTCGSLNGIKIYRFYEPCQKGPFTPYHAQQATVGCFPQAKAFEKLTGARLYSAQLTPIKCILACEEEGYHLAIIPDNITCYCTNFHANFSLSSSVPNQACTHPCPGLEQNVAGLACGGRHRVSVFRTNVDDSCGPKQYLMPGTLPLVALASAPGSGNSWLRYLLEVATGIYTGSVYSDQPLTAKGFFGEMDPWNSGRTLVIKDHIFHQQYTHFPAGYDKVILIIRDPYETLLAEFNRRGTKNHTGVVAEEKFLGKGWKKFIVAGSNAWSTVNAKVLSAAGMPVLLVKYEDLKSDRIKEIGRVLRFIGYEPTSLEDRLACLRRNADGYFKRKKDNQRNRFDAQQKAFVNQIIQHTISHIPKHITDTLPDWRR
ncbi:sialate:O-sulfotransferase 2-like [Clavelina lepadiformis]|uniref:sialate:O-sulfotransferase 2-like n=1 Tax=Clavelina lepadiformis TaxID=159417 RepID=UPI004042BFCF